MISVNTEGAAPMRLTEVHLMLIAMRDTLYEGSWDDFSRDLKSRTESRPYVFDTVPTSPEMEKTIAFHLALIDEMKLWEERNGMLRG